MFHFFIVIKNYSQLNMISFESLAINHNAFVSKYGKRYSIKFFISISIFQFQLVITISILQFQVYFFKKMDLNE